MPEVSASALFNEMLSDACPTGVVEHPIFGEVKTFTFDLHCMDYSIAAFYRETDKRWVVVSATKEAS
jgi:hypothetical protein